MPAYQPRLSVESAAACRAARAVPAAHVSAMSSKAVENKVSGRGEKIAVKALKSLLTGLNPHTGGGKNRKPLNPRRKAELRFRLGVRVQ